MTAYTTITNALVAVGAKPFATTVQALRDNPIAIAEADATVPLNLLPSVHLGTLTTTSGASQVLSSLVLTPYRFIRLSFNGVGSTVSQQPTLNGTVLVTAGTATFNGLVDVDLNNGALAANLSSLARSGTSTITTATTSLTLATASGTWNAGSVRVYGIK